MENTKEKIKIITDEVENQVKSALKNLIDGKIKEVQIDCIQPIKLKIIMEELGMNPNHDLMHVGWHYDYKSTFDYNGTEYTATGSGYYGDITVKRS